MEEYPADQLVSIPVVKLQNYKSVPVHLTEDDVRANIKLEEEEILQERIPKIRAKKQKILSVLSKLKSNPPSHRMIDDAARSLNNLMFEDIFMNQTQGLKAQKKELHDLMLKGGVGAEIGHFPL